MLKEYILPDLPYDKSALAPFISEEIMTLHHDIHHAGYVKGANAALKRLESIRAGEAEGSLKSVMKDLAFNLNGHLMHEIFWTNLKPPVENNSPSDSMKQMLDTNFGSFEAFQKEFSTASASVEGSGWGVLAADNDKNLVVHQVEKHNLHHMAGFKPVLVLDVWEHAYYLDYKNKRGDYVEAFWNIVNWEDVEKRIG
jgi:Fe-Mn family superoxide dismutase